LEPNLLPRHHQKGLNLSAVLWNIKHRNSVQDFFPEQRELNSIMLYKKNCPQT
jgi:hypothetical protein